MKKILIINNDNFYDKHALDFATRIAVDEKATLCAETMIVKGEPKEELASFISAYSHLPVMRASYGRSSLSRFFKESLVNFILEKTNAPIFIAHD